MLKSLVAIAMLFTCFAHAQEKKQDAETTTLKAEDTIPKEYKNQPATGEDVDDIITNKKMRAESGSKSRWSIGSTLVYYGGSIEKPISELRPNITGGQGQTLVSNLGGNIGIGYRITTTDRLGVDIGVRWITPGYAGTPKGFSSKFDANNPDIMYSKIYRWAGVVQSVFSAGPTFYTGTNYRQAGYLAGMTLVQNNVVEIGHSGLSIGVVGQVDYNVFDNRDPSLAAGQDDYDFMIAPYLEYVLNDRLNLRTVFNYAAWEHDHNLAAGGLFHNENTQSFGLGISVTRDIFLYPNLQFAPYNITHIIRGDKTNVALQANINVF